MCVCVVKRVTRPVSSVQRLEAWMFPVPIPLTYLLKSKVVLVPCSGHRPAHETHGPGAHSGLERLPGPLRDLVGAKAWKGSIFCRSVQNTWSRQGHCH